MEATVSDLCRGEGINLANYYSWTKEFMEAGKERLARNAVRDATRHEIEQLKRENAEVKEIAAERLLETHWLKNRYPVAGPWPRRPHVGAARKAEVFKKVPASSVPTRQGLKETVPGVPSTVQHRAHPRSAVPSAAPS